MRTSVVAALWAVFAIVTWNVIYDRSVMVSATEFTREQIANHHAGRAVTPIHEGFSPRVRDAAVTATLWTVPVLAAGAASIAVTRRRTR